MTRLYVSGRLFGLPLVKVVIWAPRGSGFARLLRAGVIPEDPADDVRDQVAEQLRPGVYAEWSDAGERFGR